MFPMVSVNRFNSVNQSHNFDVELTEELFNNFGFMEDEKVDVKFVGSHDEKRDIRFHSVNDRIFEAEADFSSLHNDFFQNLFTKINEYMSNNVLFISFDVDFIRPDGSVLNLMLNPKSRKSIVAGNKGYPLSYREISDNWN